MGGWVGGGGGGWCVWSVVGGRVSWGEDEEEEKRDSGASPINMRVLACSRRIWVVVGRGLWR